MSVNIHMHIIRDNKMVQKDIFDNTRKDSDWFNNLQGRYSDNEYDHLPVVYGTPADVEKKYSYVNGNYNFGHAYMTVKDFCDWFKRYRPDKDSGWVTKKQQWLIEEKGYNPELYAKPKLDKNDIIDEMQFIEYVNINDCSHYLYNILQMKLNIDFIKPTDIIYYYFSE